MSPSWTQEQRAELVQAYTRLYQAGRDSDLDEFDRVIASYAAGLPVLAMSRCPFSGDRVTHRFDREGLDSPFWNVDAPVRGEPEPNATLIGFTGAMVLGEPLEDVPWLVRPGPGVPYVVDRVIRREGVNAVLSAVDVGAHLGILICYFTADGRAGDRRLNDWGTREQWFCNPSGDWVFDFSDDDTEPITTDLAPWITAGKLRWIAPGDADLTLRSDVDDCPFLGFEGDPGFQRIQDGKVWTPNTLPEALISP